MWFIVIVHIYFFTKTRNNLFDTRTSSLITIFFGGGRLIYLNQIEYQQHNDIAAARMILRSVSM